MLKCWEKHWNDRPTFDQLRKTMKEMERNHKVKLDSTQFTKSSIPYDDNLGSIHGIT